MKQFFYSALFLILFSCAQQTSPTGGPKDEEPPELVSSNPANKATNFKGNQLELSFSEFIQLDKPKEQIIISPTVKEVETSYRRNVVSLVFKSPLADSTTYTISFREAVKDLTERNPAVNLKLAFSTGPYLDSLSIEGNVFDLLTIKPMSDVTVALHTENDTFNIFKHKAEYFTKADANGNFKIENLKATTFYLYAFQDKNKNLIVDGRNERYGFKAEKIQLTKNETGINLPLIALDSRSIKLISARPSQNNFLIKANKGIKDYTVTIDKNPKPIYTRGEDNSSIKVYQNMEVLDSLQARIRISDSLDNNIDTLIYLKFNPKKEDMKLDKFSVQFEKPSILEKTDQLSIRLKFNKPINTIVYDSIYFIVDSLTRYVVKPEEIKIDTLNLSAHITKKLPKIKTEVPKDIVENQPKLSKEERREIQKTIRDTTKVLVKLNELRFEKGAIISIDLDSSAYSSQKATYYKEEDLAITLVETAVTAPSFYIELLNSQGKVVHTSKNEKKITFKDLQPDEYQLRLIIDKNNNGKWDPGNYYKREEPESVYYYFDEKGNTKFNLKANWEYGPLLIKEEYPVNNLGTTLKK